MLTDTRSSIDVLYLRTILKMGINSSKLTDPMDPLFGFNRNRVRPIGLIRLGVSVAMIHVLTLFHVVGTVSSYNGILG